MCREQGRRCDAKWDAAHRERYNARRRVERNTAKAKRALADGNETKAAYYQGLVDSAEAVAKDMDAAIRAHDSGVSPAGVVQCAECGQFMGAAHSCPGASFRDSAIRDADGNLSVLHHGSSVAFTEWDPAFTGGGNDSWGSGFYFTHSEQLAHGYGEHVKSVVLNIQNPIYVNGADEASLDHVFFNASQSAAILRRHPDIYRQPTDEEETNPLGDYISEFYDKDEWTKAEIDAMISKVARQSFDDVQWSHLENVFHRGQTDEFRRGVRDATGHDGVVVDFGEDGKHTIAWFPEQVHDVGSGVDAPNGDNTSTAETSAASTPPRAPASFQCPQCGRWAGANHTCTPSLSNEPLHESSQSWRGGWTEQEEQAFSAYASTGHDDINAKLSAGDPLTAEEAKVVQGLDSALARAPRATKEQTLYRAVGPSSSNEGMSAGEWVEKNFPQGEITTIPSYTSATTDLSEANSGRGNEGVLMEVRTKQGSHLGDSGEVLLRRGSRFKVISNDEVIEVDGRQLRKVVLQESVSRFGSTPAAEPLVATR